mmetsp:Transcript_7673/g.12211  ORF Transcript_7673/g.12211 Transcript_7673/m.12211 type:complete len:87 (-) Transcript_7673:463-723(-)
MSLPLRLALMGILNWLSCKCVNGLSRAPCIMFRATGALCVSRRANATGAVEFVDCGVDSPVFAAEVWALQLEVLVTVSGRDRIKSR